MHAFSLYEQNRQGLDAFCSKALFERFLVNAVFERDVFRDRSLFHQIEQALIHRTHASRTISCDNAIDLMGLLFTDKNCGSQDSRA